MTHQHQHQQQQLHLSRAGEIASTNRELAAEQSFAIVRTVWQRAKAGNPTCIAILKDVGVLAK